MIKDGIDYVALYNEDEDENEDEEREIGYLTSFSFSIMLFIR